MVKVLRYIHLFDTGGTTRVFLLNIHVHRLVVPL